MKKQIVTLASNGLRIAAVVMCLATWWNAYGLLRSVAFSLFLTLVFSGWAVSALFYAVALWGLALLIDDMKTAQPFTRSAQRGLQWIGFGLSLAALPSFVVARGDIGHERLYVTPNITNITLVLLGVAFFVIARQGQALRRNLEQFV